MNGSHANGAGESPPPRDDEPQTVAGKIVQFPTLAERDRMRKEQEERERQQEKESRAQSKLQKTQNSEPFFKFGNIPNFTKTFIAAILIINVPLLLWPDSALQPWVNYTFGFVPAMFTGQVTGYSAVSYLSPITHIFIHGNWMHLAFNVIMGAALGTFFERAYGTRTAAIFCLLCGLAGALLTLILNPYSTVSIIGASGAISGLFGAIIITMHQTGQLGPIGRRGPWPIIIFWLVFMIVSGMLVSDLAWMAHVGGFIAGIGLVVGLQKRIFRF